MIANYESLATLKLLAAGYKVFVIDYLGGFTGPQAYVNNIEAGHAMLDAARTAVDMGATTSHTPVGFWGYSQGGAASALGATLHSSYAADVNLKGAYAGAPPLDLINVNQRIDGTMITAGALMGLNGFASRFPDVEVHVDNIMNEEGKKVLKRLANECIADSVFSTAYTQTKDLMKDGLPLCQHMRDTPLMRWHMDQQLAAAHRIPDVPVLIISNPYDDIVSYGQAETANKIWCDAGAKTTFLRYHYDSALPGTGLAHMMPGFAASDTALDFMTQLFNGNAPTSCTVRDLNK
ncbi:MAG: lipase family protein [Lawsonella sp.]